MALVAVHLGVTDEAQIDNMSYVFFQDVLTELGHKLTYDAIVNYAGNSFCEKSWEMIAEHNPFNVDNGSGNSKTLRSLADFFGKSDAKVHKKDKGDKGNGKD